MEKLFIFPENPSPYMMVQLQLQCRSYDLSYTLKLRWTCHTVTIPLGPDLNTVSNTNFVSTFCATIKQFPTWFGRRYLVSIATAVMECIKVVWSEIWQEMCENCNAINQIEERVDNAIVPLPQLRWLRTERKLIDIHININSSDAACLKE